MSGKIEMSLDEIIKANKTKKRAANKSGNKAGNKPGGKPGNKRPGAGGKKTTAVSPKRGSPIRNKKPGGGVIRGRSQGGIAKNRRPGNFGRSLPPYKREAFLGSAGPRRFGSAEATKLIVSNLDFGVTDSDILELFSEFGPLKSAGVHYDRSGRSLGSADLIFERRADAIKAMKQYNGVPLDGREMNIQLATSEIPGLNPIRGGNRLGVKPGSFKPKAPAKGKNQSQRGGGSGTGNKKGGQQQGAKRKAKPGGRGAKKPPPPTAEELDAQLEEYVKSKVSTSEGA